MNTVEVSKLRQRARQLKRVSDLTHYQALDQVAKEEGFPSWTTLMKAAADSAGQGPATTPIARSVPDRDLATVTTHPIPKSWSGIFHHVQIERMRFRGGISREGPHIDGTMDEWRENTFGQVALGVCGIAHFDRGDDLFHRVHADSWWICKYTSEARINISSLSERGRAALAHEFGIGVRPFEGDAFGGRFLLSPAFLSLTSWVKAHPRLAREFAQGPSPYVHGWYEKATGTALSRPMRATRSMDSDGGGW